MLIILINVITDAFTVKVYAETESNSVTNAENYKPYDPNIAYNQNLIIKSNNMMMRSTGLSPNDVLAVGTTACAFLPQAALITGGVTLAIYLGYKLYQEVSAEGYIREDGSNLSDLSKLVIRNLQFTCLRFTNKAIIII